MRRPPFAMIPEALLLDTEVDAGAVRLWALLSRVASFYPQSPAQHWTAEKLGISLTTVKRHTQELLDAGWLVKETAGYRLVDKKDSIPALINGSAPPLTRLALMSPEGSSTGPFRSASGPLSLFKREVERTSILPPSEGEPRARARTRGEPAKPNRVHALEELPDAEERPALGARSSRTPGAGSAAGLARRFEEEARSAFDRRTLGPSPFSHRPLARHIADWIRNETTPEEIRKMISIFCAEQPPAGKPLWVGFVGERARLLDQARRVLRAAQPGSRYRSPMHVD